jgi:hypothetical protein
MTRRERGDTGDDAVNARRIVKVKALEMSDAKNTSTADGKVVNVAPMSSETWELIEHRLWINIRKKLWTTVVAALTVIGVLGYIGIPSYIQSQFRDKIEEETKNFNKFHDDLGKQQADIYADERIFFAILGMYVRDKQTMSDLASDAVDEINQLQTQTSTDLSEYKKLFIDYIQRLSARLVSVEEFKRMQSEIEQRQKILREQGVIFSKQNPLYKSWEMFILHAHLAALDDTLRRTTERLVAKESTDEEAKARFITKFDTDFYPIYRKTLDLFETDTFSHAGQRWWTLEPGAGGLFLILTKFGKVYREWQEKQEKQHSP